MPLAPGVHLGGYEVVELLGAGGMGEVYRARDKRLKRDVAVKVLPEAFASDPDRLARFQREAELLASLTHTNIAGIYGLEQTDGKSAIVMELVEGETLAERIAQGPIPLDETLPIARQIAEALEAAHERGIVHRDLKPANIKITADGKVKVLDFGLAKLGDQAPTSGLQVSGLSLSPTLTSPALATHAGTILGTAAYMSPEQAKGKTADKRSDLWSFGCVLFEMLTGNRTFPGEGVTDTLAEVLKSDPDWKALPPATPDSVKRLLRRCLSKDRNARLSDAAVARLEIDDAHAVRTPEAPDTVTSSRSSLIAVSAVAVLAVGVAGVLAWRLGARTEAAPHEPTRFTIQLPPDVQRPVTPERSLAVSRDGRRIVFAGMGSRAAQLYVRSLDQMEIVPLPGTPLGAPFFSPDGEWVGFVTGEGALKKVSVHGGTPTTIASREPGSLLSSTGASWGPNGTIVHTLTGPGLTLIPDTGGTARTLTSPTGGEMHRAPHFLPDGEAVLYETLRPGMAPQVSILVVSTGEQRTLIEGSTPHVTASGHLAFRRGNSLLAAPFDVRRRTLTGDAVVVVEAMRGAAFSVALDGTLVYAGSRESAGERALAWVDRKGIARVIGAEPRAYTYPRVSPDGTRIALDVRDRQNDIWIWDVNRETLMRLTFGPGSERLPVWSPDGQQIAYSSEQSQGNILWWQPADGSGPGRRLSAEQGGFPSSFTPDGKRLLFWGGSNLETARWLAIDGTRAELAHPEDLLTGRNVEVSPDGRWIAYDSNESSERQVYVRSFPNVNQGRWTISNAGGTQPLWARNGRELFYRSPSGAVVAVPVETSNTFNPGRPTTLFEGYFNGSAGNLARTYDISPDGQRFLMIQESPQSTQAPDQIIVVENWAEELKQRVRPK